MIYAFVIAILILLFVALATIPELIYDKVYFLFDKDYKKQHKYSINAEALTQIFIVAIIIAVVPFAYYINNKNCNKVETVERINIFSGHNDSLVDGGFFLLSGYIGEEDTVFYWVDDHGVKTKHSKPMDESTFIEDGGEYLLVKRTTCKEGWRWFYVCNNAIYEFHVPKDSIAKMYNYK